ncbi:MAG TPA: hypothetical protein VFL81_01025, partial [Candidatus Saccharimonadales bacterium]|nr:hypothetical protein [Candidatus Saccharimonadales bacterium]
KMFRKLVENVPFSPALVGQLGFYARRLKKEETTRRLGLVFTVLALVVQSLAVFAPPESANAANPSDFIYGGVTNVHQVLQAYDRSARGNGDFKDLMDYAGITRAELANMHAGTINSKGHGTGDHAWQTWGREHRFSAAQGEVKHVVPLTHGGSSTVYSKPLWLYDHLAYTIKNGSNYPAFIGHSKKMGDFAIMKGCGNLITTKTPKPAPKAHFLAATCSTITGYAYDARNRNRDVKVYLYFGGVPGKGERSKAITANLQGNRFHYQVPSKYQKLKHPTKVWGVMVPLKGWGDTSVQFNNTVQVPGDCIKAQPAAQCVAISVDQISRTSFRLAGQADVSGGAKVKSYRFVVTDSTGKVVYSKMINSSKLNARTAKFSLDQPGDYRAKLTVATTAGSQSGGDCLSGLTVTKPETCSLNPDLLASDERCQPCSPDSPDVWIDDQSCQAVIVKSKTATDLTSNIDADQAVAHASDRIEYTVYAENTGLKAAQVDLTEDLADVNDYARLLDDGGGHYDQTKKQLSWGQVTLQPGQKLSRSFTVQMLDKIPSSPKGQSEPGSYDCVMTNSFGNTISTKVDCPSPKVVEQTVEQLPETGAGANIIFGAGLLAVVVYFWSRSKQLGREIRLVRKDVNAGVI